MKVTGNGEATTDGVRERSTQRPIKLLLVVRTNSELAETLECFRGFRTNNVNKATGCVSSEQRSLRPAKHLNSFQIKQLNVPGAHCADIGFINIECDGRFEMIGKVVL